MTLDLSDLDIPNLMIYSAAVTRESILRLFPAELGEIQNAVTKRQQEYATARCLARKAMLSLGFPEHEILNRSDRSPIWPDGMVGSLSHCDKYAIAVVAASDEILTVGCDIEPDFPLPDNITEQILLPEEIDNLESKSDDRLIFSAKEAFYKAQYQVTGTYLDFKDVTVKINHQDNSFQIKLNKSVGIWDTRQIFRGRLTKSNEHLVTLIHMRP